MDDSGKISFVVLMVLIFINIALQFSCDLYVTIKVGKFDKQYSIAKEYKSNNYSDSISLAEAINTLEIVKKNTLSLLHEIILSSFVGIIISVWQIFSNQVYKHILSEAYNCRKHSAYIDSIKIVGYIISVGSIITMWIGTSDAINNWKEISGYVEEILQVIGKVNI